jgi:hypothetical protein
MLLVENLENLEITPSFQIGRRYYGFDVAMKEMKKECPEASEWLNNIHVACWARHAFDTNCKTDMVVNNLSEVFNRMILDIRAKPIKTTLEDIRTKLRVRYEGKRTGGAAVRWEITPTYSEKLEENKKYSRMPSQMVVCGK